MTQRIRERFPDKIQIIDRLMAEDPGFCDTCEDYDVCVNALRYWSNSTEPEAEIRVNEYRTLAQQIEDEVAQAFAALKSGRLDCSMIRDGQMNSCLSPGEASCDLKSGKQPDGN